jgi:hypothetical protein
MAGMPVWKEPNPDSIHLILKGLGLQRDLTLASAGMDPGSRPGRREFFTAVIVRLDRTSRLRPVDSFSGVSGILDRPIKSGDDERECGATPQPSLRA